MIVQRLGQLCTRLTNAVRNLLPQRSRRPRPDPDASFDGVNLRARTTLGEPIEWSSHDFEEIGVQTTAAGPFVEDVFWVIQAHGRTVCIPQESDAAKKLLEYASSVEHFDWEPFIQAMGCTDNQYFRCWNKRRKDPM